MIKTANLAAGLLMCQGAQNLLEFFLVHLGGPYFRKKELGTWSIPKGLPEEGEGLMETALREFFEETGITPTPPFHHIGIIKQKGGKVVHAWAFHGSWDPATGITCNDFSMEWPPHSGKQVNFPEVDKAAWMDYEMAKVSIIPEQIPFLERARTIFSQ